MTIWGLVCKQKGSIVIARTLSRVGFGNIKRNSKFIAILIYMGKMTGQQFKIVSDLLNNLLLIDRNTPNHGSTHFTNKSVVDKTML